MRCASPVRRSPVTHVVLRAARSLLVAGSLLGAAGCSNELKFTGVEPNSGTFTGGEEVVLAGNAFPRSGVAVKFGNKDALAVVMESPSRIKVTTPAGDKNTNTDVTIVFDDGRQLQLKNGFRYVDTSQQTQARDKFFDKVNK